MSDSQDTQKNDALSVDTSPPPLDDRPVFETIRLPVVGDCRLRRMPPEQIFGQLAHFERFGIALDAVAVTDATRPELVRFLQRQLVKPDVPHLKFPGPKGEAHLGVILQNDDRLQAAVDQALRFQELSD